MLSDKNKENMRGCVAIFLLVAELLICTGIGGIYGWATGMIVYGLVMLAHTIRGLYKIKRMP